VRTKIPLPTIDKIEIVQVYFTATECALTVNAVAGEPATSVTVIVRNGTTAGCRANKRPKTIQAVLSATEHRTPTGYRDLMAVLGRAAATGKDVMAAIEKHGRAAGWFLG
jgi:hypothetical protein